MGVDLFICGYCYEPFAGYGSYCLGSHENAQEDNNTDNKTYYSEIDCEMEPCTCSFSCNPALLCYECYEQNGKLCRTHLKEKQDKQKTRKC